VLERIREEVSQAAAEANESARVLWDILSAAYAIRDAATDESTLAQADALADQTRSDLDGTTRRRVAEERRAEQIRSFRERREHPPKRALLVAALVWAVLLPVWVGALFVFAAVSGSYGKSVQSPAIVISASLFVSPWLVLGWLTIRWWREGRNNLWRPPLVWLLLLIPYFWLALPWRRPRSLLSASHPE
jgi:hypothetical protein